MKKVHLTTLASMFLVLFSMLTVVPVYAADYTYDVDIQMTWKRVSSKTRIIQVWDESITFTGPDGTATAAVTLDATTADYFNIKLYKRMVRKLGPGPYTAEIGWGQEIQTTFIYATKGNAYMRILLYLNGASAARNLILTITITPPP